MKRNRFGRFFLVGLVGFGCGGSIGFDAIAADIERVVGDVRLFLPRTTGRPDSPPCTPVVDTTLVTGIVCDVGQDATTALVARLVSASPNMTKRLARTEPAVREHLRGVWSGVWPQSSDGADGAVNALLSSIDADATSAVAWSDLSAALLIQADYTDDVPKLVDALSAARRALALDSGLVDAHFNHALALELLQLRGYAERAWQIALRRETRPDRAAEIRLRLLGVRSRPVLWQEVLPTLPAMALSDSEGTFAPAVRAHAANASVWVGEILLPQWAEAIEDGRSEAGDSLLTLARRVIAPLRSLTSAALAVQTVDAVSDTRGGERATSHLARGFLAFARGRREVADTERSLREFALAAASFRRAGSPFAAVADYNRALVETTRREAYDRALSILGAVQSTFDSVAPGPWHARTWRLVALIHGFRADWSRAEEASRRVLHAADSTDRALRARTLSDVALATLYLRGYDEAWPYAYASLEAMWRVGDARVVNTVAWRVASLLMERGDTELALLVQDEAVRITVASAIPALAASALRRRAELNFAAGVYDRADADADAALQYAGELSSPAGRRNVEEGVRLIQAEIDARIDPERALPRLAELIADFKTSGYVFKLARAHLALAQAQLGVRDDSAGTLSLVAALEEVERQRDSITGVFDRTSFVDRARPLFDRLVSLHVANDDVYGAFGFLERTRSRVLLEEAASAVGRSSAGGDGPPNDLQGVLDSGTAAISYAVIGDSVFAWVARGDTITFSRVVAERSQLRNWIDEYRAGLARGRTMQALAAQLHDRLIAPLRSLGPLPRRLVIIPDRWLHYLPFAVLWDSESERYLIERHDLVIAPSLRFFWQAAAELGTRPIGEDASVFAVGDPAFPRDRYTLPRLPHAAREAEGVRSRWSNGDVVTGPDATRDAVLEGMNNAAVVHLAAHSVLLPDSPLDSYLLLAGDGETDERVTVTGADISGMRLSRTALVILSACDTADGRLSDTEGPASLARAFLAAGVPGTVASLWAVDDEDSAAFFAEFHDRLSDGANPATALAESQRHFLMQTGAPGTWAAFQYIGGN